MFGSFQTLIGKQTYKTMIRIKKMQAEHIYLIEGASVANSPFFETEADCELFLKLADNYLKEFLWINSFQNNRDGWVMIITTKSDEAIRTAYHARIAKSKKCKAGCAHQEIWRMLSDQIRIWLATYVKSTNENTGRKGGKVRGNYKRYVFENEVEAEKMKKSLSKRKYNLAQPLKRYRPSKKLCSIKKKHLTQSIYLSCARLTSKSNVEKLGLVCLKLAGLAKDVLRHLVKSTLNYHFPPDPLIFQSI